MSFSMDYRNRMICLFDCYGELLTDKQRTLFQYYFDDDLSLAEISEPRGITRQAVRDGIKRSEQILLEMEEKLGFAKRLSEMKECFDEIKEISENISDCEIADKLNKSVEKGLSLLY